MTRTSLTLYGTILALLLAGTNAQATLVPASWHYDWLATPSPIILEAATNTKIVLTNEPSTGRTGPSNTVATDIFTTSNSSKDVTFSGVGYNLEVKITDDLNFNYDKAHGLDTSNDFKILDFGGLLDGTISKGGSVITNVFLDTSVHSFDLGNGPTTNHYSIQVDQFVAPSGPGAQNAGSIGGIVIATGHEQSGSPRDTPEPSTMLLSCLGLSFLGAASWRKARGKKDAELVVA